jgi:hypothetical protein
MSESDLKEQRLRRTLKAVAERAPVAPADETFWDRVPPSSSRRPRRILVGAVAAVILVAGAAVAIADGPRSSDVGGSGGANTSVASSPKVPTSWTIPAPTGYVPLQSSKHFPLGVLTLQEAAKDGEPGNSKTLRRAGWRSGIAEIWAPKTLVDSGHGYSLSLTIQLAIDRFGSTREASTFQAKTGFLALRGFAGAGRVERLTMRGIPGVTAAMIKVSPSLTPSGMRITEVFIDFHRGPYLVVLSDGQSTASGTLEHFVEHLAQVQFARLPH